MENKPVNKKDSSKVVLIVVILILLGVIGYLVFTNHEKQGQLATQNQKAEADSIEIEKTKKELLSLQMQYQEMKDQRDALGLRSDSLGMKIQEIELLLKKAKDGRYTDAKKLKDEIAKLKADLLDKEKQLQVMIMQNDTLKMRYDSIQKYDVTIKDSLSTVKAEKSELAAIVKVASVLKADNIKVTVINPKGKELDEDTYKAKTINKLKISFDIAENKAAKKGSKEVYLRVIEPSGSTLFQGEKIFTANGKEIFYTEKRTINYNNEKQSATFIYQKGSPYKPGTYSIELFAEENKIGEGKFVVK